MCVAIAVAIVVEVCRTYVQYQQYDDDDDDNDNDDPTLMTTFLNLFSSFHIEISMLFAYVYACSSFCFCCNIFSSLSFVIVVGRHHITPHHFKPSNVLSFFSSSY